MYPQYVKPCPQIAGPAADDADGTEDAAASETDDGGPAVHATDADDTDMGVGTSVSVVLCAAVTRKRAAAMSPTQDCFMVGC